MSEQVEDEFVEDEELQEILCNLEVDEFYESVDRINTIVSEPNFEISSLAKNIIHISCFLQYKLPLFVHLVSVLKEQTDIVAQIENLIDFGVKIGAEQFYQALIAKNLISKSCEAKLK